MSLEKVNSFGLNQDKSCFYLATNFGYKIFSTVNMRKLSDRNIDMNIDQLCMYYKTNLLFFVLKPTKKQGVTEFVNRTVHFWDDINNESTGNLNFNTDILKVDTRFGLLFVVRKLSVSIVDLKDIKLVIEYKTGSNDHGSFVMS